MAIYRKEWNQPNSPWKYRLDIVPYDTSLDGAVVALDGNKATLIELGTLETAFDGLPFGLQSPPQMTMTMAVSTLPAALQTALRAKYDNGGPGGKQRRNTFLFYSNRGLDGVAATFLDFAGTPAKINGNIYKYEAGEWLTEIELVDCLYIAALHTPMASALGSLPRTGNQLRKFADLPDYRGIGIDSVSIHYDATWDATNFSNGFYIDSFDRVVNWAFQAISNTMNVMFSHQTSAAPNTADRGLDAGQMIGRTIGYFTSTSTYPRTENVLLNSTTAKVVTHIGRWGASGTDWVNLGGLTSDADEVGWAKYENAWDWYKDLCEACAAKASYSPILVTFGSPAKNYLHYDWNVYPVRDHAYSPLVLDGDKSVETPEIKETEDGVGKAECRVTTFEDADIKEFKVNAGVMRADKQFTSQVLIHNMPVMPDPEAETDDTRDWIHYISGGLNQSNRFCTKLATVNEAELVHTTVRIYNTLSTYTDYQALDGAVDIGAWIPRVADDDVAYQNLTLYLNAVQRAGCTPTVLAKHLTNTFGSDDVAALDLVFRLTDYATLGDATAVLGAVCDLSSSSFAANFPHLNWSTAILTALEVEHVRNTVKASFILLA